MKPDKKLNKREISPLDYENALYHKLLYDFPPPSYCVVGDDRSVTGRFSGVKRRLDVAVYRTDPDRPFLVADAKRRTRRIHVGTIESFIGQLDDVGAQIGILASPFGFSDGARRRAAACYTTTFVMSVDEALEMNWRVVAQIIFPEDPTFHPQLAAALHGLEKGEEPHCIVEAMEEVPYEEWQTFVAYGLANRLPHTTEFLRFVALHHHDDAWRFNAVAHMLQSGTLDQPTLNRLLSQEEDPDVLRLLRESGLA
jgi:hypothetical protein